MPYAADLHLHSHHAGGTSPDLTLANLLSWAQLKGIDVVATGDCLHGAWLAELREHLAPGDDGFLHSGTALAAATEEIVSTALQRQVRFVLSAEVSCEYRHAGRLRRVHHLVLLPDFAAAHALRKKLARHGNLDLDGRPTVHLSSRELLARVLEVGGELVPAHIWNPFCSLLSELHGYDSVSDCFGDLTPHLLACEAALTSTPSICRRVSQLDGLPLLANSDAHRLTNVGRECNLFEGELTRTTLFDAIRGRAEQTRFLGTIEFPPTLTCYWANWCSLCQTSRNLPAGAPCPRCGQPLIGGVEHRLAHLIDRSAPVDSPAFAVRLPLLNLLHELSTYKSDEPGSPLRRHHLHLLHSLGSERDILEHVEPEAIARESTPAFAETILAQRAGRLDFSRFAAACGAPPEAPAVQTELDFGS